MVGHESMLGDRRVLLTKAHHDDESVDLLLVQFFKLHVNATASLKQFAK